MKRNLFHTTYPKCACSILVLFALFIYPETAPGQSKSKKRGLAYGYNSPADLSVLSAGVSWWYNWSVSPESTVAYIYEQYDFDFVPMAWNGDYDQEKLRAFLAGHPNVKYILAFNEPNFVDQANMTPGQAAAAWPALEAIADEFNLKIVGPAVNYCGNCVSENDTTYSDPIRYLDAFFAACPTCRVDYIAFHSYMNTVGALQWYLGNFKKYNKPVWLTEFAGWESNGNIKNANDQVSFMIGAVDMLETDTDVFRYAWFIGRAGGITQYPFIDILGADGVLTGLGQVYTSMPVHDPAYFYPVPGKIEAEGYTTASGILLERTQDVNGFANVGYIDRNDWLEYNIHVPQSGEYTMNVRIACNTSAQFEVLVDGLSQFTKSNPATGGWQSWVTISHSLALASGDHNLRLKASTAGFNLNWLEIVNPTTSVTGATEMDQTAAFPNPVQEILFLDNTGKVANYSLKDMAGRLILTVQNTDQVDMRGMNKGMYILTGCNTDRQVVCIQKIIKE